MSFKIDIFTQISNGNNEFLNNNTTTLSSFYE